jgi:hypothetical protein
MANKHKEPPTPKPSLKETLITRIALAAEFGVSLPTLDRWIHSGVDGVKLVPTFIGHRIFFKHEDVTTFMDRVREKKVGPTYTPPSPARRTPPEALERLRRNGYKVGADI